MQPPGRERPSSSSRPQRIRVTSEGNDSDETIGSAAALVSSPLENRDLLAYSLRRLPAMPSSLLRASLVSKDWAHVVSDPQFLRDFRAHHGKPPLLGFLSKEFSEQVEFAPMLDPPDKIPASRFSIEVGRRSSLLHCHYGRVLVHCPEEGYKAKHLLVWDPVTGDLRRLDFPPALVDKRVIDGGIVCTSSDQGHVHGACHSDPFQVVVIALDREGFYGSVYTSETRAWGNILSVPQQEGTSVSSPTCPSTLFRNAICKLLLGRRDAAVLDFDWARQSLAVIDLQLSAQDFRAVMRGERQCLITHPDSGGLSFILLAGFSVHVWKRTSDNGDGVATWMLGNTIDLHNLLALGPEVDREHLFILGLDEHGNLLLKLTESGNVFMVHLESRKFKRFPQKLPFVFCRPSQVSILQVLMLIMLDVMMELKYLIKHKMDGCP